MSDELIVNKALDDVLKDMKDQVSVFTSQIDELISDAYYERDPDLTFNKGFTTALKIAHASLDSCFDISKYSFIDASRLKDGIIIDFLNDIGLKDLAERVRKLCR